MHPLQLFLAICLTGSLTTTMVLAHVGRTKAARIAFVAFLASVVAYALVFLQH